MPASSAQLAQPLTIWNRTPHIFGNTRDDHIDFQPYFSDNSTPPKRFLDAAMTVQVIAVVHTHPINSSGPTSSDDLKTAKDMGVDSYTIMTVLTSKPKDNRRHEGAIGGVFLYKPPGGVDRAPWRNTLKIAGPEYWQD